MTTYPHRVHIHRPNLNPWLIAVVVLAAALVGVASWVVVDQTTSSPTTAAARPIHALASAKVVAMLDARFAALNSGGQASFAQFYSPDTEFTDFGVTPPITAKGAANVASLMGGYSRMWAIAGQRITRESQVIQAGDYVAHALRLGPTRGMSVYQLDQHGKIAGQWVFGS